MTKKTDRPYELLVELADFDPKVARPGDWLNWRYALDHLMESVRNATGAGIYNVGNPQEIAVSEEEVLPIHTDLRRLVRQYAAGKSVSPVPVESLRIAAFG